MKKSQESIQKQILTRKENFYKKLLNNNFVTPLFSVNELDTKNYNKIYRWQCKKCKNIFESKLNHLFYSRKKIAYARCLNCFPIDRHNAKLRYEKYGNNMGDIQKMLLTKQNRYGKHYEKVGGKISKTKQAFSKERKNKILQMRRKTCLQKYGVDSFSKTKLFRKNLILYSQQTYGTDSPNQVKEIRLKQQCRYTYNNIGFDSKIEIACYIWLTDHHFNFKYQAAPIEYQSHKKKYLYFPDFEIIYARHPVLIEFKGIHFFKPDGKMFCPFRDPKWTDKQYKYKCDREEAKHQCMIKHNVRIIKSNSKFARYLFNYIFKKYGKTYLNQLKNAKP